MTTFSTVCAVLYCIFLDLDGLACGTGVSVPSFFGSSTGISKTWIILLCFSLKFVEIKMKTLMQLCCHLLNCYDKLVSIRMVCCHLSKFLRGWLVPLTKVSVRMVVFPLVAELLPYTSVQALSWIINCGSNLDRWINLNYNISSLFPIFYFIQSESHPKHLASCEGELSKW